MTRISYSEAGSGATAPGSPLGDLLGAAKNMVCDLYQNYPDYSFGDPLGVGAISRGIWDGLCKPERGPAPVPIAPPPGGQCRCVLYTVRGTSKLFGPSQNWEVTVKGPVGGSGFSKNDSGTVNYGFWHQNSGCTGWQRYEIIGNFTMKDWSDGNAEAAITSIERADGTPDLCGNGAPQFPPIVPPPGELTRPAPITIAPGIQIPINLVYIRPDIDLTFAPKFNIPIAVKVNADVGISFGFDIGGIDINLGPGDGSRPPIYLPPDPRSPAPTPPQNPLPPGTGELLKGIDDILTKLKELKDCACAKGKELVGTQYGNANSRDVTLPPDTVLCTVEVTSAPQNIRGQAGVDAPDVLYCGWAWFRDSQGGLGVRQPMDSAFKAFVPQRDQPSGFCYTLQAGCQGRLTTYREVEVGK